MSIRHLLVHQISFLPPAHSVKLGLNRPPGSSTLIIMVKRSNTPDGQKLLELYLFGSVYWTLCGTISSEVEFEIFLYTIYDKSKHCLPGQNGI